ncbi:hypothetical protein HGB07_10130 [Candidatus Roizmanbacteria bacterium]|nr:hypothetical protein [Candidatus Roizmanbacteria bacterium]
MKNNEATTNNDICPKCGAPLGPVTQTPTGKNLRRCSKGSWNAETRQVEGCAYTKWLEAEPETLDEKCPKCGANLVLATTRFGKKMKKCSTSGWNKETKTATGCDYIQWLNGTKEELEELCPFCQAKLVLMTTSSGKKMKKCSTSGWDRVKKEATGCNYIQWLNDNPPFISDEEVPPPPEE